MTSRPPAPPAPDLPWGAWYGDRPLSLDWPEGWHIDWLRPPTGPEPSPGELAHQLDPRSLDPAQPGWHDWLRDADHVAIAVDDCARPTPVDRVLESLLDQWQEFGWSPDRVRVVVASGAHAPPDPERLQAKLGPRVLERCRVEIHNPHGDLVETGIPYGDRQLRLNRTFFTSPRKVCLGSVLPHPFAGFGGGAKLILPGLTDLETTERSHKFVLLGLRGGGDPNSNQFRGEAEAIARQLGPIVGIACVTGGRRELLATFSGDLVASHRAASARAAALYATPLGGECDCLVLNAYPKDVDLLQSQGALLALRSLPRNPLRPGGVALLTTAASTGVGQHELFGPGGRCLRPPRHPPALAGRSLWVYAPILHPADLAWYFPPETRLFTSPADLRAALLSELGPAARCVIVPTAPLQQLTAVTP